ncbi:MAG: ABC transporter ATP-binding protein, partial [Gammaproteobacteria bacterium]|nr:ABC transporter ATP-binding protein [Gammaproteobacteria bacterium]
MPRDQSHDKPQDALKQILLQPLQRYAKQNQKQDYHAFWALKNINIAIPKG